MTTRDELRQAVGTDRGGAGRGLATDPELGLPERLYAARERKGVDLYRAERDTKIRSRHLAALERGDYKELPGPVYTRGFLRNYALYLGLDPDEILLLWRRERGEVRETPPSITVPRPIARPRAAFTVSPSLVVIVLLTTLVLAFGAYLGSQVLRFTKPPTIAVTDPATALLEVDESTTVYTLRGLTLPGAAVSIATPGRDPYEVSADPDGDWRAVVDLRRGRNQFDVAAVDLETGKRSENTIRLFITVPFLVIEAPTLAVDQPAEGTTFDNGAIPLAGRAANAASVAITVVWLGSSGPALTEGAATSEPPAIPLPPEIPAPITVKVADDGSFATPLDLTAGIWAITVTAASPQGKTAALTRTVTVTYKGVNLVVTVRGSRAWLKVWVDGKLDPDLGAAGSVIAAGRTLTFTGSESVEVRSGSSGATHFTLNGTVLGALGPAGIPETWLFKPPDPPVQTERR